MMMQYLVTTLRRNRETSQYGEIEFYKYDTKNNKTNDLYTIIQSSNFTIMLLFSQQLKTHELHYVMHNYIITFILLICRVRVTIQLAKVDGMMKLCRLYIAINLKF